MEPLSASAMMKCLGVITRGGDNVGNVAAVCLLALQHENCRTSPHRHGCPPGTSVCVLALSLARENVPGVDAFSFFIFLQELPSWPRYP